MPKIEKELKIQNKQGLHARPAAAFVQIVAKHNSNVIVRKGKERVNGTSIMGLLTLGVQHNAAIIVEIDGDDAEKVLAELETFLSTDNT
jgi:phosphocarrier protein